MAAVAVILVGTLIALAYVALGPAPGTSPTWYYPQLAVRDGDMLNYTIEGDNATGPMDGYGELGFLDITVNESFNAYSYYQHTAINELNATSWGQMLFGPGASICYGRDVIDTAFGVKHVDKFIEWSQGVLLISFVGSGSGIGYRLVLAGDGYGMNVTLAGATVEGLEQLDTAPLDVDRTEIVRNPTYWLPIPSDEEPEVSYYPEQRTGVQFGLLDIDREVHIHFHFLANGSAVFFFTAQNIAQMENMPRLTYDPALSIPSGNGTIDYRGVPGLVYFIKDTSRMDEATGLRYEMVWYD